MSPNLPDSMTCIEIREPGGPEVLVPATRAVPQPGDGEVLVKVAAAGVNRPDVLQRAGGYPPPPGASDIPGLELAGTIVALGANVEGPALGDEICALVAGGGYAEYCVASAALALPVPKGFDLEMAAAIPETFFTVWTNGRWTQASPGLESTCSEDPRCSGTPLEMPKRFRHISPI